MTAEWSDDDAFWAAMEPALCAPSRLALAEGDVAGIVAALALTPGAAALDLACGPGAHALAFAARGCPVTAVDRTARLLERARTAATERGLRVEWVQADMREFRRPGAFDVATSLYASWGYFEEREDDRRVLENVLASLRPGGALVLDLSGRESVARHWREHMAVEIAGVRYEETRRAVDDWSSLVSDWTVVRDGVRSQFRVRQRLYAGTELKELLTAIGFADVRLFGSLALDQPYDHAATRLVAVARRPGGSE